MRRCVLLLAVLIAGCGAHRTTATRWPKMATHETDGGESIAPRAGATSVAAAAGDDDDDDDIKVVVAPAAATPAATPAAATPAATPAVTSPDDPLQVEEITIEIDD